MYMSPHVTSPRAQLPPELVLRIFQIAWIDTDSGESRSNLYNTIAASHPCLHAIVAEIASRYVMLDLGPGYHQDLQLYLDTRSFLSSSTTDNFARQGQQGRLVPKHVRVDSDINEGRPRLLPVTPSGHTMCLVTSVTEDCASFTLNYDFSCEATLGYDSPTLATARNGVQDLSFLAAFRSLTSLHIHHRLPHLPIRWIYCSSSGHAGFRALTFLRLWEFPRCGCAARHSRTGQHTTDRSPGCLLALFAQIFPNVHSLQIDTPVSLCTVDLPHTLKTLAIEAPPIPYEYDGPARGSLLQWELGAALNGGFMRWKDGPAPREDDPMRGPPPRAFARWRGGSGAGCHSCGAGIHFGFSP